MSSVETAPARPDAAHLKAIANQLRIHSIVSTTAAGSGHPTTCMSAAEVASALFFGGVMRYHPDNPSALENDRLVLSKGHAAPLLYAAWAEAGYLDPKSLTTLRLLDSPLEGHPTRELPFVDVATGSLGQGLGVGIGQAIAARMDGLTARTFVLMGDGEIAEGSVWEAASLAGTQKLDNLVGIVDVNVLGQSAETAFGAQVDVYRRRWEAFGWHAIVLDGQDMEAVLAAFDEAAKTKGVPTVLLAKTQKGAGVSFLAGQPNWHGKALKPEEAERAIAELQPNARPAGDIAIPAPDPLPEGYRKASRWSEVGAPPYKKGDSVATREAFGFALERLGAFLPNLVVVDADTQNSTFTDKFHKKYPERFVEAYIAEQNMVSVAVGLGTRGKIPVASTFSCFLTRAFDQIRMAGISHVSLKLCGSHSGVSIGEDGASQMGLEDLAMMRAITGSIVLYPSDAVSAERLTELLLQHEGVGYLRTSRPKTPVIYGPDEEFPLGGSKVVRSSDHDKVTVAGVGVTLYEALKAADLLEKEGIGLQVIDAYSIKPIDADGLAKAAARTGDALITVEDHYPEGGLGDATAAALSPKGVKVHALAVTGKLHSGKAEELLERHGISANCIVKKAKELIGA